MITFALWLVRIKSILTAIVQWIANNWQLALFGLLLFFCAKFYLDYKGVQEQYESHLASDAMAAEIRRVENQLRREQFDRKLAESEKKHKEIYEKLNLNRARETHALKELYHEKETGFMYRLNAYRDRVRLEPQREATAGLPTPSTDTFGLAESERNCYAAYSELEAACKITTIDYNRLREWADATCDMVECK